MAFIEARRRGEARVASRPGELQAFSVNAFAWHTYFSTSRYTCVWRMITRSGTPARAADVTRPAPDARPSFGRSALLAEHQSYAPLNAARHARRISTAPGVSP